MPLFGAGDVGAGGVVVCLLLVMLSYMISLVVGLVLALVSVVLASSLMLSVVVIWLVSVVLMMLRFVIVWLLVVLRVVVVVVFIVDYGVVLVRVVFVNGCWRCGDGGGCALSGCCMGRRLYCNVGFVSLIAVVVYGVYYVVYACVLL